ncbi:cytosolic thiouridylase subunit Ctu2 [Schizosaccharomyces japonicus yFS275]|uniref:Cytoplasmic tRNA 2-thiolation protein 2 n=1 Tax=Schizosaccharomyces japonicus (strain yFS275 / FY16936) TaxID=402676 RepID=B6K0A9_SCHJY|nr:cytosolic thiouridylase subunit Ctu2 [Schizosaccharomyces japonicus yFS275]EEB06259.1 cytosolic thiouridylase subunit Ctu2 [Schizosaccharomyces japonicus yFS275]
MESSEKVLLCKKCKAKAVIEARSDAFCEACYIRSIENKIRRQFELLRPNLVDKCSKKALVCVSGGLNSMAMLETVYYLSSYREDNYRPMFGDLIAVHLQLPTSTVEEEDMIRTVIKQKYPKCAYVYVSEHEYMSQCTYVNALGSQVREPAVSTAETEQTNFLNVSSTTSRQDLLHRMRDRVLLQLAHENHCDTLVYGDSASTLAAKTLELVAEGRGHAIPASTGVCTRPAVAPDVAILRPLREVLEQELRSYMGMKGLQFVSRELDSRLTTMFDVSKNYFLNLGEQFPSLVSTIVRTSGKLSAPQDGVCCRLCLLPMQENTHSWLNSTTVQHPTNLELSDEACKQQRDDVCYGCMVSLGGLKAPLAWPRFVAKQS